MKANEDLKDVVVGIYYNNSQQNTETISKTDVLDAGNPFNFLYTAFLPSFLSSVYLKQNMFNFLYIGEL